MHMLLLLGGNYCLSLFHMDKCFNWFNGEKGINEFKIGYKAFREQVDNFITTTFGAITQYHIRATLAKK